MYQAPQYADDERIGFPVQFNISKVLFHLTNKPSFKNSKSKEVNLKKIQCQDIQLKSVLTFFLEVLLFDKATLHILELKFKYTGTPPYDHPFIRPPRYYGLFFFSPGTD